MKTTGLRWASPSARIFRVGCGVIVTVLIAGFVGYTPLAYAAKVITYEVTSKSVPAADIEYVVQTGSRWIGAASLPWRLDVVLTDTAEQTAQLRAVWRPAHGQSDWVTVRISDSGHVVCQATLEIGNATCQSNIPSFN